MNKFVCVVGKPINVEKIEKPTEEDVKRVHKKYMEELKALFDKYKSNYEVYKDVEMEFV